MTTKTEAKAMEYLLTEFSHERYKFLSPNPGEGCEIVVFDRVTKNRIQGELKSSDSTYNSNSDIRARLVFNKKTQKDEFENGDLIIVRIFMGNRPHKVILITHEFLNNGAAELVDEERYVIRGKTDYDACLHLD